MTLELAIIHLVGPGLAQVRPAAFVWQTGRGIAWLEPGYLYPDPYGPTPAFHMFDGEVEPTELGLVVNGPGGTGMAFDFAAVAEDPDVCPPEVRAELERFESALAEAGTTWGDERVRMGELLAADLEMAGGVV